MISQYTAQVLTSAGRWREPVIRVPRDLPRPLTRARARALFFLEGPPIFANSIPKSGTHVLSRLLALYPRVLHSGRHIRQREVVGPDGTTDWSKMGRELAGIGKGQFGTAHFPADPQLLSLLSARGFRVVFMVRDPRDMLVSYVFYVVKRKQHFLHERLVEDYPDTQSRLAAIIKGLPSQDPVTTVPSARERLDGYIDWLDCDFAYTCHFEDLIGARGGGSDERQLEEVQRIGPFINRPVSTRIARRIADQVWSKESITFRKGVIGDWRSHFTSQHRDLMKEYAGDYLVRLGYEQDNDW